MDLLIDFGNTRVKWALVRPDGMRPLPAFAHGETDWLAAVDDVALGIPPRTIWIAAVGAQDRVDALLARLARAWPEAIVHRVQTRAACLGVRIAYAEPERLGVDRFLMLLGARARTSDACLVAGLGTALAIDALDAAGRHLGGLIAPSPELMRAAVLERTARVGWREEGRVAAFGATSEDGLESGCWLAAAALVERSADEVSTRAGSCTTFLSGGGSARLAPLVRRRYVVVEDLVLEGLARYADEMR